MRLQAIIRSGSKKSLQPIGCRLCVDLLLAQINASDSPSVLDAVELFLDLSATLTRSPPVEALIKGRQVWVQEALGNRDVKIIQSDIAGMMGSTQSKVSRLARSEKAA